MSQPPQQPRSNEPRQDGQYHQPDYPATPIPGEPPALLPQPPHPGPPAGVPPQKSMVLRITVASVAVALTFCLGGAVTAAILLKDNDKESTAAVAEPRNTPADPPTTHTGTVGIVAPPTLGGRPKLNNKFLEEFPEEIQTRLKSSSGATISIGGLYGTIEQEQEIVIVAAVKGHIKNPDTLVNQALAYLKITNVIPVSTGTLGGVAKCGESPKNRLPMPTCSWADNDSLGVMIWDNQPLTRAASEFPTLRPEIEQKD